MFCVTVLWQCVMLLSHEVEAMHWWLWSVCLYDGYWHSTHEKFCDLLSARSHDFFHHSTIPVLVFCNFQVICSDTQTQSFLIHSSKWKISSYMGSVLSLGFNGHYPGESGLAGVCWSKGWWKTGSGDKNWSYKSCKAPVKSSPPPNQHQAFYRPDALPVDDPVIWC